MLVARVTDDRRADAILQQRDWQKNRGSIAAFRMAIATD
jgi:hypothetical protein